MSSDASEKLQEEMKKTLSEIDKRYLRKMQGEMHRCAILCCEDETLPVEKFQRCIDSCGGKIHATQEFIRSEINNFQDRLNRCHMACNDEIRDKMSPTPSQSEIEKYRNELDKCAGKCAEAHLELISQILKRTKEFLKNTDMKVNVNSSF